MRADDLRRERLNVLLAANVNRVFFPVLEEVDGSPTDSKLHGTPFLPKGKQIPACKSCKRPMVLILQLDIRLLPAQSPVKPSSKQGGLLQVFHCHGSWDCGGSLTYAPGGTGVVMRIVDPKDFTGAKPDEPSDVESPAPAIGRRIVGWTEGHEPVAVETLVETLGRPLDAKESRLLSELRTAGGETKMGGTPNWIQSPDWAQCPTCHEQMPVVFQLQSTIVDFGDSGLGYLSQCSKHPGKLSFSWSST